MNSRKFSFSSIVASIAFVVAFGFGTSQAIATNQDVPGTQWAGCNSVECRRFCPEFGGDVRRVGTMRVCYCCLL